MEEYIYYIEGDTDLIPYDYNEIIHSINNGIIPLEKKVLVYDPLWRDKKYVKAKTLL